VIVRMNTLRVVRPTCSIRTSLRDSKYLRFAERVNGRCAMQGFVWGLGEHLHSGSTFAQQLTAVDCDLRAVAVAGLVALGSAFTLHEDETPAEDTERLVGLVAMIGFLGSVFTV